MPAQPIHFPAMTALLDRRESGAHLPLPLCIESLLAPVTCQQLLANLNGPPTGITPLRLRRLTWELGANGFIMRLQKLTGRERLLPDLHLWQGGVLAPGRESTPLTGGLLHPETGLSRALSLLLQLDGGKVGSVLLMDPETADCPQAQAMADTHRLLFHYYSPPDQGLS